MDFLRSKLQLVAIALLSVLPVPCAAQANKLSITVVSEVTVESRLKQYSGKDDARQRTLMGLFEQAGCSGDRLATQDVKGARLGNIICSLPGTTGSVIVVGAHFDHVTAGQGVVDNWSGASMLPTLFESLHNTPRKHTFLFISFTDEEKGLVGSEFYVRHLSKQERTQIPAMVNIDSLGLTPTEVWVSHADKNLVTILVGVARLAKLPITGMNVERIGSTDSESFARYKIPSITLHSITTENLHVLHTKDDQYDAINLKDYYASYQLVLAYLANLDRLLD